MKGLVLALLLLLMAIPVPVQAGDTTTIIRPNGDGGVQWGVVGCAGASDYDCVDDVTSDGDATYMVGSGWPLPAVSRQALEDLGTTDAYELTDVEVVIVFRGTVAGIVLNDVGLARADNSGICGMTLTTTAAHRLESFHCPNVQQNDLPGMQYHLFTSDASFPGETIRVTQAYVVLTWHFSNIAPPPTEPQPPNTVIVQCDSFSWPDMTMRCHAHESVTDPITSRWWSVDGKRVSGANTTKLSWTMPEPWWLPAKFHHNVTYSVKDSNGKTISGFLRYPVDFQWLWAVYIFFVIFSIGIYMARGHPRTYPAPSSPPPRRDER